MFLSHRAQITPIDCDDRTTPAFAQNAKGRATRPPFQDSRGGRNKVKGCADKSVRATRRLARSPFQVPRAGKSNVKGRGQECPRHTNFLHKHLTRQSDQCP